MEGFCGREGVVAGGQQVLVRVGWLSEQVRGDVLASDRDGRVKVRDRLSKCIRESDVRVAVVRMLEELEPSP